MDNREAVEIIEKEIKSYAKNKNLKVDPVYIDALKMAVKELKRESKEKNQIDEIAWDEIGWLSEGW